MKKYFCIKEYSKTDDQYWYYYVEYNTRILKWVFKRFGEALSYASSHSHRLSYEFHLQEINLTTEVVETRIQQGRTEHDVQQRHFRCKHIATAEYLRAFTTCLSSTDYNPETLKVWYYGRIIDFNWSDAKVWLEEL